MEHVWICAALFFAVMLTGVLIFSWIKDRRERKAKPKRKPPAVSDNGLHLGGLPVKSDSDTEPFGV